MVYLVGGEYLSSLYPSLLEAFCMSRKVVAVEIVSGESHITFFILVFYQPLLHFFSSIFISFGLGMRKKDRGAYLVVVLLYLCSRGLI